MFDWDDLRVFTGVVRSGSFAAAAPRLGLDATTIGRRIQRLETSLKTTLLVRAPDGLQLTTAGSRLYTLGDRVAAAIDDANALDDAFASVRISASEGFGTQILAPALAELFKSRPSMSIELAANQGFLSPSTREVDIAITLTPSTSARVAIEKLTDYELGLFASADYLRQAGEPATKDDLKAHPFVGYIDDMLYAPELRYLSEVHPELRPRLTSSSIRAQAAFARAGAGLAILPCFLVGPEDGLVRVLPEEVRLVRTFWLSIHHDIKDTARIRSVRRWLTELVASLRDSLLPSLVDR